jgi:WavE lipopolysaccharide synthesis
VNFVKRLQNSLQYRTRYFLFSKIGLPSTSFRSLLLETSLYKLDSLLSNRHGVNLSVSIKPKADEDKYLDPTFAVIFHGKILNQKYLMDNLSRMREACPRSHIVLSSYLGDVSLELREICSGLKIDLVLIDEPNQLPVPYMPNFVRGVASAHSGLIRARDLGAQWGVKIRVDQDISKKSGIDFVNRLFNGEILPSITRDRIIGSSYNTYANLPIFLSDMIHFGSLDSLINYWQPIEIANISQITEELFLDSDDQLLKLKFNPEVWLAARYMHLMGVSLKSSTAVNEIFWKKFCGVVDSRTIGLNWVKTLDLFDSNYASIKWLEESFSNQYREFHFADWVLRVLD